MATTADLWQLGMADLNDAQNKRFVHLFVNIKFNMYLCIIHCHCKHYINNFILIDQFKKEETKI